MASYTDTALETATLHGSLSMAIETFDCWEYLLASSNAFYATESRLTETALLHGVGTLVANGLAVETATVHSSIAMTVDLAPSIIVETALLHAAIQQGYSSLPTEVAVITSSLAHTLHALTTESAAISGSVPANKTRFTLAAYEVAELSSSLPTNNGANLVETATLHSSVAYNTTFELTATETALLNDAAVYANIVSPVLADSAALSDSVTNHTHGHTDSTEVGYLTGQYFGTKHTAWVSSLKQLAMSRYDNLHSMSMALVKGVVIGAGDEGLYLFDKAVEVDALVKTGKLDFGSGFKKRVEGFYVAGESEAPLQVDVTCDSKGIEKTYSYDFTSKLNESTRNTRAKLGRGLNSRHYQFTLTNPGGTFFAARAASVDAGETTRRT